MRIVWQQLCTVSVACTMNSARWLSLVGLGVTFPTVHMLHDAPLLRKTAPSRVEEAFTLVSIGILLIATAHHLSYVFELCRRRGVRTNEGASREERSPSLRTALIVALSLLMLGIAALSSMAFAAVGLG